MRSTLAKLSLVALAASLSIVFVGDASAAGRKVRKRYDSDRYAYSYRERSHTVASNGLCQRDTGVPNSSLNFRNRCDTQEFWTRMERGRR